MKQALAGLLSLFIFGSILASDNEDFRGTRFSRFNGKDYSFDLRVTELARAPAWKAGADFPPLAPFKARDIALKRARQLCPGVKEWGIDRISLQEIDQVSGDLPHYWIYLIDCEDEEGPYSGPSRILEIPVLMNGAIPELKIKSWK